MTSVIITITRVDGWLYMTDYMRVRLATREVPSSYDFREVNSCGCHKPKVWPSWYTGRVINKKTNLTRQSRGGPVVWVNLPVVRRQRRFGVCMPCFMGVANYDNVWRQRHGFCFRENGMVVVVRRGRPVPLTMCNVSVNMRELYPIWTFPKCCIAF